MFDRLKSLMGRQQPTTERSYAMPPGVRAYAIGDIHGEAALLRSLLDHIVDDCERLPQAEIHFVFLGDYIDRGPDSKGVIELLTQYRTLDTNFHFLKGNHEDAMLAIIDGNEDDLPGWLRFGGRQTLDSYGISQRAVAMGGPFLRAEFAEKIPSPHLAFLRELKMKVELGDYLFVHAGIRPGVPLDQQDDRDLMWIRREFLGFSGQHPHMVVHGHTISPEVELLPNRIGVDTGAYASGRLSAVVLEGSDIRILSACESNGKRPTRLA
jgi:serine/threonine protein phosphatase 1